MAIEQDGPSPEEIKKELEEVLPQQKQVEGGGKEFGEEQVEQLEGSQKPPEPIEAKEKESRSSSGVIKVCENEYSIPKERFYFFTAEGKKIAFDNRIEAIETLRAYASPQERLEMARESEKKQCRDMNYGIKGISPYYTDIARRIAEALHDRKAEIGPFGGLPGFAGTGEITFPDGSSVFLCLWGKEEWGCLVKGLPDSEAAKELAKIGVPWPLSESEQYLLGEQVYVEGIKRFDEERRWVPLDVEWKPKDPAIASIFDRTKNIIHR